VANRRRKPKSPVPPLSRLTEARAMGLPPRGMSQAQVGDVLGVSRQAVNAIEHGQSDVTGADLRAILGAFGVSADWLLGSQHGNKPHPDVLANADALLREVAGRTIEKPTAFALSYLQKRDPSLFSSQLFTLRLGISDEELQRLLDGEYPGGTVADRLQDLLRIPATWFLSGDAADLRAMPMGDAELLWHELTEAGVDPRHWRRVRHTIIAALKDAERAEQ